MNSTLIKTNYGFNYAGHDFKIVKKGYEIQEPSEKQVLEFLRFPINKLKINSWHIVDNSAVYNDGSNWSKRKLSQINEIIVNCTNKAGWDPYDMHIHHRSTKNNITPGKPLEGIGCHIFVHSNGMLEKTNSFTSIIPTAVNDGSKSIIVTFDYRFTDNYVPPTKKIIDSLERVLTILCLQFKINPKTSIYGQNELFANFRVKSLFLDEESRESPGPLVPVDHIRNEVLIKMQRKMLSGGFYGGPVDGKPNKAFLTALSEFNSASIELLYETFE